MAVGLSAVREQDWAQEVSQRNGVALSPGREPGKEQFEDAGPWEPAVQKIVSFQKLGDNWDGFGADGPSREVVESAIGLAYCFLEDGVDPPHRVAPGVCGAVIFEWQDADGTYTELEIDRPFHAEVMVVEPGKPARQWTLPTE